jgi:type I restriction enzyme M protein
LCAFAQNPLTQQSNDEDLYLETIAKYKGDKLSDEFPHLLACLVSEMEQRWDSGEGYDILGDFYEIHLARKGISQFFTPWPICMFMAKSFIEDKERGKDKRIQRVLDPCCGSGRMLLAYHKAHGQHHEFYGVDIDPLCAKMTALNLFLSGLFHSEALCADALVPEDFNVSYKTSFLPFGVFRIKEKEQSFLWHLLKDTWKKKEIASSASYEGTTTNYPKGGQLKIF